MREIEPVAAPAATGRDTSGEVADQLRTMDTKARNASKLCTVPRATLQATRARLKTLLGI